MKDQMLFRCRATAMGLLASTLSLVSPVLFSEEHSAGRTVHVSGSGTDELSRAVVHSKQPTSTGYVERSTATVELNGDLHGLVLYHVTSVVDLRQNTLVNTGDQVFSGTIAGSEPVMLHDSKFRFDEDLAGGKDEGTVYLLDHIAGPRVRCLLKVKGTGKDGQGNPTFTYTGECTFGSG